MRHVVVVGASHRTCPVELREQLSFGEDGWQEPLERLAGDGGEAAVLSTCNRICLYLADEDAGVARSRAIRELAEASGLSEAVLEPVLYSKSDRDAALHLFRVAAGLDSLVPGEAQILGQVRAAFETSDERGTAGQMLHRMFSQALHAGRRVRNETGIGETPASVSTAAAELASRVADDLATRRVLLVGAGKMGQLAAESLMARGPVELVVANRSLARGEQLATRFGGRAVELTELETELAEADVVIASTGSRAPVLTVEDVGRAVRRRKGRPLFLIDIAVPRDIDPLVNDLDDCYLYDIDDLEQAAEEVTAGRHDDAARAEAIVREEVETFEAWRASLDVVPEIASLRRRAEAIRSAELERASNRLVGLSPQERRAVELLTAQIVNKLLHAPTVRLKEAAAGAQGVTYAQAVRDLFDLAGDDR